MSLLSRTFSRLYENGEYFTLRPSMLQMHRAPVRSTINREIIFLSEVVVGLHVSYDRGG
jgi:hypothetical protein